MRRRSPIVWLLPVAAIFVGLTSASAMRPVVEEGAFATEVFGSAEIAWPLSPEAAEYSKVVLLIKPSVPNGHLQTKTFLSGVPLVLKASEVTGVAGGETVFHYEMRWGARRASMRDAAAVGRDGPADGTSTSKSSPPKAWEPISGVFAIRVDAQGRPHFARPATDEKAQ